MNAGYRPRPNVAFKLIRLLTDITRVIARTLRSLRSPLSVTGRRSTTEFGDAVRQMWLGLTIGALLHLVVRMAYDNASSIETGSVVAAVAMFALLSVDRVRQQRTACGAALASAVCGIGVIVWIDSYRGDDMLATSGLLLFTLPALVAAYHLSLARAMATVTGMTAFVAADVVVLGGGEPALLRLVTAALVFGGTVPLVSITRLRTDMSIKYLHEASIRDSLTGLLNRRGVEAELQVFLDEAADRGSYVAMMMADIDYFKAVNDRHGHAAGDQLLMEIGTLLHLYAPSDAVIGRIGGEEFAVIMPGLDFDAAIEIADDVRSAIGTDFMRSATKVTMSMGVVSTDRHGPDLGILLEQADQALYAAKTLGRNRSVGYSGDVLEILERVRIREEEASRNQLATLLTLAEALDLRDASTATHSHVVADYAEGMAIQLGLDHDLVERVRLAGLLHDIGKIGVPDSVLLCPGKLDDEQWDLMRQHPEIGARMLNHVDYTDIRDWVLAHHERIDGRGYPLGLDGDDIPLPARILAVADAYEAMTADRVYRKSPGHAFARSQLRECSGSQFDPEVVAAMERFLDASGIGAAELAELRDLDGARGDGRRRDDDAPGLAAAA